MVGAPPDESLGSPAQTQILRSISHISDVHSARGLTRVTSVAFLHFPHKEILSSKAPSKAPLRRGLHYLLAQPTLQKNEGKVQEPGRRS